MKILKDYFCEINFIKLDFKDEQNICRFSFFTFVSLFNYSFICLFLKGLIRYLGLIFKTTVLVIASENSFNRNIIKVSDNYT